MALGRHPDYPFGESNPVVRVFSPRPADGRGHPRTVAAGGCGFPDVRVLNRAHESDRSKRQSASAEHRLHCVGGTHRDSADLVLREDLAIIGADDPGRHAGVTGLHRSSPDDGRVLRQLDVPSSPVLALDRLSDRLADQNGRFPLLSLRCPARRLQTSISLAQLSRYQDDVEDLFQPYFTRIRDDIIDFVQGTKHEELLPLMGKDHVTSR
ncbi:MAG: hypothetical protein J07HQW2_03681 [Haloquadratum walsbyi J07HQW2]|uniref:Uncharacterized protein n=1 Tax=Haloquadratum walsbyi J07HQW2 TaxID=1238425 RepID=U1NIX8_9EURY|nr:MAG: hypothetical protein J07HQW2_03681 [Haloquadratum walsbyi J07HQW2]